MKIKFVLPTALFLALGSIGFAQSKIENVFASNLSGEAGTSQPGTESETWAGELQVGKTDSVILYVGAESGDYAAFCFKNSSKVGRAILAACKNREQCQFTGEVIEAKCKVPGLEASLSASSRIVSIKSVKKLPAQSHTGVNTATAANTAVEPRVIIKNLYAAQKAGSGPFFQTKDRAVVDKYFGKDLADLIWKDAVASKGEVGAIDFDPLYGSQDPQITAFKIMETGWGGDSKYGPDDEAVVQVTFKDSGKERMVSYQFKQGKDKKWKIYDIHYRSDGEQVKLVEVLTKATAGIILGCRMPSLVKESILKFLSDDKRYTELKTYEAVLDEKRFRVNIVPI